MYTNAPSWKTCLCITPCCVNFDASSMPERLLQPGHCCSKLLWSSKDAYMYSNRCRCSCTNCNPVATVPFCQCRSRFPMELCMGTQHPTKLSNGTAFLQHQLEHQLVYWELLRAPQNDMIGCKATNINHIHDNCFQTVWYHKYKGCERLVNDNSFLRGSPEFQTQ